MDDSDIIAELKKEPASELRRLQHMPYAWKLQHAIDVVHEFVEHEGEDGVYVSFSGGKDSTVLLHLVRSLYPGVPAVFANTGIEFPEQVKFVRQFSNVTEVYPVKHFPRIIREDGIVFPSKEVAMYIRDAQNGCRYAVNGLLGLDTEGRQSRYRARFRKWAYLLGCGVKISPVCCELMKERPLKNYERETGRSPFIGTRAEESFRRAVGWMRGGCNSIHGGRHKSTPLALWTGEDVMQYIRDNRIELSPMYRAGLNRTGCMFCPVPIAHGDMRNVLYARDHHPRLHETIMVHHGLGEMLGKAMMRTRWQKDG